MSASVPAFAAPAPSETAGAELQGSYACPLGTDKIENGTEVSRYSLWHFMGDGRFAWESATRFESGPAKGANRVNERRIGRYVNEKPRLYTRPHAVIEDENQFRSINNSGAIEVQDFLLDKKDNGRLFLQQVGTWSPDKRQLRANVGEVNACAKVAQNAAPFYEGVPDRRFGEKFKIPAEISR